MSFILFCHFLSLQYSQQPFAGTTFGLTLWLVTTSVLKLFSLISCFFFSNIIILWAADKEGNSNRIFCCHQVLNNWLLKFFIYQIIWSRFWHLNFFIHYSAAMLCFYSYVMISGGNPPPKKLQESAGVNS